VSTNAVSTNAEPEVDNADGKAGAGAVHFAALPLISVLSAPQMKQAQSLLEELEAVEAREKGEVERGDEIKRELGKIQVGAGLVGLRFGQLCFKEAQRPGKKTLNKVKLVEKGVAPELIVACTDTGKPFAKREFKKLLV